MRVNIKLIFGHNNSMKDIYIVSDVHLDYIVGEQNTIYKNFLNMFEKDKTYFIAGDIYDNLEKTLRFLSDMEKNEINCYFVLGNHEFHELRHAPTMANFHG
jgi:UDP-2,3-diacylglucosamine pyrophosphatase LpxH